MIGYVTVGTNDLKKAGEFYDKICGELGMGRFMANDRIIAWGGPGGGAGFGVALPYDGKPMTVGNGVMAAFGAKDKAQVDRVYKLALSLGCKCEGTLPDSAVKNSTPPISAIPMATSSTPS
jgi:catechol 2,3-dioxygenase-like lactoylglutathione lyase family enzyme